MTDKTTLAALFADYPVTRALKSGELDSALVELSFSPLKTANKGFKPFVRELAFDVGELALVTFLQAVEHGRPLVLAPATVMGRFQHHCLVYDAERGVVGPRDLEGKRIGVRAYSQTTGMWVRGILQNQYGTDPDRMTWVTVEEAHVAEYVNPPNVVMVSGVGSLREMLLGGEVAAAILSGEAAGDGRLRTVIPEPEAAARDWYAATGAIPMNHMLVVTEALTREHPEAVAEVFRLFNESKALSGAGSEIDVLPIGLEAVRPGLELAIRWCRQQRLIERDFAVEELFNEVTIGLA